jgi:translation initiation factor IF-3
MAQERGLDLVEVAPLASPPVVKFLDFGQYKYELTKREKENKRRQRSVTFKEVRLSPKIGQGDFDTKVHRAIEFLEDGDRIKVTVRFRGRELTHPELGRNMLTKFTERIKEHGVAERAPLLEGKSMHLTVASLHKPREHESSQRQRAAEGTNAAAPAAANGPAPANAPAPAAAADTNRPAARATTEAAPASAQAAGQPAAQPQGSSAPAAPRPEAAQPAQQPNGAAGAQPAASEPATPAPKVADEGSVAEARPSTAANGPGTASKPTGTGSTNKEPVAASTGPVGPAKRTTDSTGPAAPAATGE